MSHSAWFEDVGQGLAGRAVRVGGLDRRGSGANDVGRGSAPSPEALVEDVRTFVEHFRGDEPLVLLGWCWGAVLAIAATLELRPEVDGLILAAPGVFPSALVRERAHEEQQRIAGRDLDELCARSPVTEEMFTDGPGLEFIRSDERRLREFTPRFFRIAAKLGAIAATRLRRLDLPVLLLLADRDDAVDNARTLEAFSALDDALLTTRTLRSRHGIPFDAPGELVDEITDWISALGPPGGDA